MVSPSAQVFAIVIIPALSVEVAIKVAVPLPAVVYKTAGAVVSVVFILPLIVVLPLIATVVATVEYPKVIVLTAALVPTLIFPAAAFAPICISPPAVSNERLPVVPVQSISIPPVSASISIPPPVAEEFKCIAAATPPVEDIFTDEPVAVMSMSLPASISTLSTEFIITSPDVIVESVR